MRPSLAETPNPKEPKTMKTQAHSLRRKAYRLHSKADQALSARRVYDAAALRDRAHTLEAKADALDEVAEESYPAGFTDADFDRTIGCTAMPRAWSQR